MYVVYVIQTIEVLWEETYAI